MFALVLLGLLAADPAANTLTRAEIADGWLLLFDGETTFGWRAASQLQARSGTLVLGVDNQATTVRIPLEAALRDYELRFEYQLTKTDAGKRRDPMQWALPPAETWASATLQSRRTNDAEREATLTVGPPEKLAITQTLTGRAVALHPFRTGGGEVLTLRNVKLKPLGLKSIFNGKDLAGWKVFPERKSTFTVDDGVLTIKNGPGDLQTEGKWADFLLQLECRSNGKHLNSGVFFRCRPNEYQQGYEAQIHNAFTDEPAKEYLLDVYDPATNKLLDKKKVKYQATDYGTGAIYRRQPAQVSRP